MSVEYQWKNRWDTSQLQFICRYYSLFVYGLYVNQILKGCMFYFDKSPCGNKKFHTSIFAGEG